MSWSAKYAKSKRIERKKNMFARHKYDTDTNPKQSGGVAMIEIPTLLRLLLAYI